MKKIVLLVLVLTAFAVIPALSAQNKKAPVSNEVSQTQKVPEKPGVPFGEKLALYIPNLFLDFVDIFSLELQCGIQPNLSLRATRAFGFAAAYGTCGTLSKDYKRKYGWSVLRGSYAQLFAYQTENMERIFTSGNLQPYWIDQETFPYPSESTYNAKDGFRDYWALEAGAAFGLGVHFAIHPTEIWDFLCGFLFFDPSGDNIKLKYENSEF